MSAGHSKEPFDEPLSIAGKNEKSSQKASSLDELTSTDSVTQVESSPVIDTSHDSEPPSGGPKGTKQLVLFEILASIGSIMMGMDQFVVSGASLFAQPDLHISSNQWSWITSGPLFGAIVGSIIAIPHNALFGRRMTFISSCILYDIGVFMSTFTPNYGILLAGRLIFGVGKGLEAMTLPIYLAELVPKSHRGGHLNLFQAFQMFGDFLGAVITSIFANVSGNWRFMFGSGFIAPTLQLVGMLFVPESPRWLIQRNRREAAYKAWQRIRQDDVKSRLEFEEMVEKLEEERCNERPFLSVVKEVFVNPRTRAMFIFGGLLPFASLWSGSAAVGYYMSDLFKSLGLTDKKSIYMQLPVEFINFVSVLPAFCILDRFGRRRVMLFLMPISVVSLIMIGVSTLSHNLTTRVVIFVIGFFIYYFSYNPSYGTLAWVVNGELFEAHTRNLGMAQCAFWIFANAAISTYTFSRQIKAYGVVGAFGVFVGIVFTFWLLFLFIFVDTSKLSLEDVKDRFNGGMTAVIRRNTRNMLNSVQRLLGKLSTH
eukprot:jgi/Galph1/884/GphlegSOOS_G5600.1